MAVTRWIAVVACFGAFAAPAAAAPILVTSTADTGTGTLRAAIASAPATPTTIVLPVGTIALQTPLSVTGKSLTIVGEGAGATTISGSDATRIMTVTDASTVALNALTLSHGSDPTVSVIDAPAGAKLSLDHTDVRANHSAMTTAGDGAFLVTGGSLSMSSGTVADNVAGGASTAVTGGIVDAVDAGVSVTDETFTANAAGGGTGPGAAQGGLFAVDDTAAPNSTLTLTRVTATQNTVGGGVDAEGFGLVDATNYNVVVTGSTFTDNLIGGTDTEPSAGAGGFAILTASAATSRAARVSLVGSTVRANRIGPVAGGGTGGAIAISTTSSNATLTADVQGSLIADNVVGGGTGPGFGGAVVASSTALEDMTTVSVASSTIAGNRVGAGVEGVGGAISVSAGQSTATLNVDDSTLTGNDAGSSAGVDGFGGAIQADQATTVHIGHSTITANQVAGPQGHGGGIYAGSGTIGSTIVAGNTADDHRNCQDTLTSAGHNLDSGNDCAFTGDGDLSDTDPGLTALGDHGGPLPTQTLLVDSAAGNSAGPCTGTDERGVARPQGAACDIGAVEAQLPAPTTLAPSALTTTTATLAGTLAPISDPVTTTFDTGATATYGTSLTAAIGPGLTVSGPIEGLVRRTTYHARLVATSAAGTVDGNDVAFTTPAPVATLGHFRFLPATFAVAAVARATAATAKAKPKPKPKKKRTPVGTSLRFSASDIGAATMTVSHTVAGRRSGKACVKATHALRHHKACTRTLLDGSVHFRVARSGAIAYPFSGRIGRHALATGSYTATLILLADGAPGPSTPVSARFSVRPR